MTSFFRVAAAANPRAVLWQDEFNQWHPLSSDQIYQRVRALATAFLSFGAKKGDRIALISENRWEWAVTDFATLAIGAADVPSIPRSPASRSRSRFATPAAASPWSPRASSSTSCIPCARKPS
jgi:long-chain acyl-CoA synthetase